MIKDIRLSPLRHLDMSDDSAAADMIAAKARQLAAACERIQALQDAIGELLWLIEYIARRDDIGRGAREALLTNHRITDARELLI